MQPAESRAGRGPDLKHQVTQISRHWTGMGIKVRGTRLIWRTGVVAAPSRLVLARLMLGKLILRRLMLCGLMLAAMPFAAPLPASAQGWWPFGGGDETKRAPVPREPVYKPNAQVPAPIPPAAGAPPGGGAPPPAQGGAQGGTASQAPTNWATKNPICLQLEQRLIQEGQKGNQSREQLPKLETELREVDRAYNVGAAQLDKSCYEYFLFTKSFRNTTQCKELLRQVEVSKRRLAELEVQRQQIAASSGRSYQDDIIRELARNNCGANYADQARRREGGVWQDEESVGNNSWSPQGGSGVATYRTLCVRLCDGFYFPVSFSTLPSHFPQDADACQSKCSAPTELYYHPNPGGSVDQAVALKSQEPYTHLKSAFRYRKEFVNGCSCKEAEFVPAAGTITDKKADGGATVGPPAAPVRAGPSPGRRAEVPAAPSLQSSVQQQPAAATTAATAAAQGAQQSAPITTGSTNPRAAAPIAPAASPQQ